jgi:sulfatase modifying factor 1
MKNALKSSLFVLLFSLYSCGSQEGGELTGALDRPSWSPINPYGMVYVPSGTLMVGPSDQDVNSTYVQRPKQISIQGFYMDETEITNNEYRQFVEWVRDSIARKLTGLVEQDEDGNEVIDWRSKIDWEAEELDEMYLAEGDFFLGKKLIDVGKFNYEYEWFNWEKAALAPRRNSMDKNQAKIKDFTEKETVNIYPDTLVWIRNFAYSYNEPMARQYFSHPAYDDYPVVGVNWAMAKAFTHWRTQLYLSSLAGSKAAVNSEDFRLPSEHEWEYAARGGHELAPFPWGGPYIRNAKGCLLANFKPGRGDYPEDGGFYTVKADAYFPNDYGLYNMAGNVSEWTNSAFHENFYSFMSDLNPNYTYNADDEENIANKRKVVRGGSWKDIHYFLQTGTRDWEYQDTTKAYIGFRCVLTFLGRSINDF